MNAKIWAFLLDLRFFKATPASTWQRSQSQKEFWIHAETHDFSLAPCLKKLKNWIPKIKWNNFSHTQLDGPTQHDVIVVHHCCIISPVKSVTSMISAIANIHFSDLSSTLNGQQSETSILDIFPRWRSLKVLDRSLQPVTLSIATLLTTSCQDARQTMLFIIHMYYLWETLDTRSWVRYSNAKSIILYSSSN